MNRIHNHVEQVNLIGQVAELKELVYQQSLLLSALTDLLLEHKVITQQELAKTAGQLDREFQFPLP